MEGAEEKAGNNVEYALRTSLSLPLSPSFLGIKSHKSLRGATARRGDGGGGDGLYLRMSAWLRGRPRRSFKGHGKFSIEREGE